MNIHISRDGNEIGVYPEDDVIRYLAEGSLLRSDFAWHENLTDWVTLATLFPPKEAEPAWKSEAATDKQIEYIKSFGAEVSQGLTKGEASEILDHLKDDPDALLKQQQIREEEEKKREENYRREAEERASFESYYTKLDLLAQRKELEISALRPALIKESIKTIKAQIKELKKQLADIPDQIEDQNDEIEALQEEIKDIPDEIRDLKEDIKESEKNRIDFWLCSFSSESLMEFGEVCFDLYERFGVNFKRPTKKIVSDLLHELDEDNLEWDKQDMSVFFSRLQKKHPESIKKC